MEEFGRSLFEAVSIAKLERVDGCPKNKMAKNTQKKPLSAGEIDKEALKKKIESKLFSRGITDPKGADRQQTYFATVAAIKDYIAKPV